MSFVEVGATCEMQRELDWLSSVHADMSHLGPEVCLSTARAATRISISTSCKVEEIYPRAHISDTHFHRVQAAPNAASEVREAEFAAKSPKRTRARAIHAGSGE